VAEIRHTVSWLKAMVRPVSRLLQDNAEMLTVNKAGSYGRHNEKKLEKRK
jgi:hypothetical protein